MYAFIYFFWPHISGLLTLRWPFGQYDLFLVVFLCHCLYFYAIAVDELNK